MNKSKARLVTIVIFVFLVLLLADTVSIWPASLPYILGAFAIPGAWKFCRVLYIWLTTEEEETPIMLKIPKWKGWKKPVQEKTYRDYAAARSTAD